MRSDQTLLKWYRRINKRFFEGQCPDNVCVRWANPVEETRKWESTYFGEAGRPAILSHHEWEIVLSRVLNVKQSQKLASLAHEMCHLATECRDNHGPAFERWRAYIAERGIFRKHALLKHETLF